LPLKLEAYTLHISKPENMKILSPDLPVQQSPALKAISDYLGPINTICFLGIGLLDLLTPIIGRAISLSVLLVGIFGLIIIVFNVAWQETKSTNFNKRDFFRSKKFLFSIFIIIFASILLFAKALSTSSNSSVSNIAPKFVASLQNSLGIIQTQNTDISNKLDEVQASLKDLKTDKLKLMTLIDMARTQYEDSIKSKVANYNQLSKNQKDALALAQSQLVRTRQQDKARSLYRLASEFAVNPSKETRAQIVAELTKLFPSTIPGEQRVFLGAMFFDRESFEYLVGERKILANKSLFTELNAEVLLNSDVTVKADVFSTFLSVSDPVANIGSNEMWPVQGMDGSMHTLERTGENTWRLLGSPPKGQLPFRTNEVLRKAGQ
jgi:hypothetical protein